jgi:hypothetical protein
MAPDEPTEDRPADPARDALRRLEERLERASDAAERLLAQAAGEAARATGLRPEATGGEAERPPVRGGAEGGPGAPAGPPPPAGWQSPRPDGEAASSRTDADLLVGLVQSLRDLIPPELQARLAEALREVLLAIRALIDWYLERLEQRRSEPAKIEDIPIL